MKHRKIAELPAPKTFRIGDCVQTGIWSRWPKRRGFVLADPAPGALYPDMVEIFLFPRQKNYVYGAQRGMRERERDTFGNVQESRANLIKVRCKNVEVQYLRVIAENVPPADADYWMTRYAVAADAAMEEHRPRVKRSRKHRGGA